MLHPFAGLADRRWGMADPAAGQRILLPR